MKSIINFIFLLFGVLVNFNSYSHDFQYELKLDSIVNVKLKNEKITSLRFVSEKLYVDDQQQQVDLFSWWILKHLKYDIKMTNATISTSLKKGLGVCRHYAVFFDSLSIYRGLDVELIHGFCKLFNSKKKIIETPAHAWNSVTINGEKRYLDLTWTDENIFLDSLKLSEYYLSKSYPFYLSHYEKNTSIINFRKFHRFRKSVVMYGSFEIMRPQQFWIEDGFYRVKDICNGFFLSTKNFKKNIEFLDVFLIRGFYDETTDENSSKVPIILKETSLGVFFINTNEKLYRNENYTLVLRVNIDDKIRDVVLFYGVN